VSYGACHACGCAFEASECPARQLNKPARRARPSTESSVQEIGKNFKAHGTFIRTYECFKYVCTLAPVRAHAALCEASRRNLVEKRFGGGFTGSERSHDHVNNGLMINDGWIITQIDRSLGFVEVLANDRGRYVVYRASLRPFLELLRERIDTYSPLRHLYFDLTTPHEHA
jgi:hypothetical protein